MIRLITLNCWKDEGDWAARIPAMAAGLSALDADIVCLQEVYAGGGRDTGAVLAAATGRHCTQIAAREKQRGGVLSSSGVAILSRQPPSTVLAIELPTTVAGGGRKALLCRFKTVFGDVQVASLHLSHLRDAAASALRAAQLAAIIAVADPAQALVLAGDFNAPWDAPELAALHAPGWASTAPALAGRSSLIGRPAALIDHIALRAPHTALALAEPRLVLDQPSPAGVMPSDHAGVMALILRK